MDKRLQVLVLSGGCSAEHEVSLSSAKSVIEALDKEKYEVIAVIISPEGEWSLAHKSSSLAPVAGQVVTPSLNRMPRGLLLLANESKRGFEPFIQGIDLVFPVLHGPYGEDGTIQGFCEIADLPYVGAGVLASAVGMDKGYMKIILREAGLPVVDFLTFKLTEWRASSLQIAEEIEKSLGYPVFVKPAALGSSIGISKANARQELVDAVAEAGLYQEKILVEKAIDCRELECGVLGDEEPEASVLAEIIPGHEFYDYETKYSDELVNIHIPASLPATITGEVQRLSITAFKAIGASGMARVDFFLENGTNKIYLNEINTIPGFTATSVYPKLWEASGIPYSRLLDRLIELAIERHKKKAHYRTQRT